MSRCLLACGVVAASVAGAAGTVQAEEIFIENYSFEALELPESTWLAGAPDGWTLLEGHFGVLNPSDAAFPGGIPDGYNVAYSNGGTIGQVLSAVLQANTLYSLDVTLGNRPTLPFPGYLVQLLAGGVVIAEDASSITPDAATFAGTSVSFQTPTVALLFEHCSSSHM